MSTCPGIQEHCNVPKCKNHHDKLENVTQVAYHVCNTECKNDKKHNDMLISFNDSAPQKVVDSFATHKVFINKSSDDKLQLTDTEGDTPLSIFYYDENKKVFYHAENIFNNASPTIGNVPRGKIQNSRENEGNDKADEKQKDSVSDFKSKFMKFLGYAITVAAVIGIAFTIPQVRTFIIKSFPKIKKGLSNIVKMASDGLKNTKNFISKKFSFLKKTAVEDVLEPIAETQVIKPPVNAPIPAPA